MSTIIWKGNQLPNTNFAIDINAPVYTSKDGTPEFNKALIDYVYECEQVLEREELVSPVTKNEIDPYKYTQHWKQHNILDDSGPRLDGDHLEKFKTNPVQQLLFNKLRENYLLLLADLKYPRKKVWIHSWANIIRHGEFISPHTHIVNHNSYLASVYYPQSSKASLYLAHPTDHESFLKVDIKESNVLMFPAWVKHHSDINNEGDRVSIAADIVVEDIMLKNPWRPHILFDDPKTMKGL